jgi:DNA repair protein RadC
MTGSVSIILLHNHPEEADNVLPSNADENLTDRIKQAANILEIKLLDHIIISRDNYYSFQEHGKIVNP